MRILVKHVRLGLNAVVVNGGSSDTYPFTLAVESAYLDFGAGAHLLEAVLCLACLDIELAFKDIHGAEGAHARLTVIYCGEKISVAVFDKIIYLLHLKSSPFKNIAALLYNINQSPFRNFLSHAA